MQGCLEAACAALRKLRDESECDVLKKAWTGEDPGRCDWNYGARTVGLWLNLSMSSTRAAGRDRLARSADDARLARVLEPRRLPDSIGKLGALTELS